MVARGHSMDLQVAYKVRWDLVHQEAVVKYFEDGLRTARVPQGGEVHEISMCHMQLVVERQYTVLALQKVKNCKSMREVEETSRVCGRLLGDRVEPGRELLAGVASVLSEKLVACDCGPGSPAAVFVTLYTSHIGSCRSHEFTRGFACAYISVLVLTGSWFTCTFVLLPPPLPTRIRCSLSLCIVSFHMFHCACVCV